MFGSTLRSVGFRLTIHGLACVLLTVSLPPPVAAQSAKKIIQRGVETMGGKDNLKRLGSREIIGTAKRQSDGAIGTFTQLTARPDFFFYRLEFGDDRISAAFNGLSGWTETPRAGLRGVNINDDQYQLLKIEADYRNDLWYQKDKQRGMPLWGKIALHTLSLGMFVWVHFLPFNEKTVYAGVTEVNGRPAQAIGHDYDGTHRLRLHFDDESGRLVKEEFYSGGEKEIYEYDDFRTINGLLEPHLIRWNSRDEQYEIRVDRVTHNQPVDAASFDFPTPDNANLPAMNDLLAAARNHQQRLVERYGQYEFLETHRAVDASHYIHPSTQGDILGESLESVLTDSELLIEQMDKKVYEVSFHYGERIKRLVSKHGMTLSPEVQGKEDSRIARRKERITRKANKNSTADQLPDEDEMKNGALGREVLAVLQHAQFRNLRRSEYRGREAWLLDFTPPLREVQADKFVNRTGGTIWLDPVSLHVMRLEAHRADRVRLTTGKEAFIYWPKIVIREQARVCGEVWLPTYSEGDIWAWFFMMGVDDFERIAYTKHRFTANKKLTDADCLQPAPSLPRNQ